MFTQRVSRPIWYTAWLSVIFLCLLTIASFFAFISHYQSFFFHRGRIWLQYDAAFEFMAAPMSDWQEIGLLMSLPHPFPLKEAYYPLGLPIIFLLTLTSWGFWRRPNPPTGRHAQGLARRVGQRPYVFTLWLVAVCLSLLSAASCAAEVSGPGFNFYCGSIWVQPAGGSRYAALKSFLIASQGHRLATMFSLPRTFASGETIIPTGLPLVALLALASWRFWRPLPLVGHCRACGYNLTGNTSGTCPECGFQFGPRDVSQVL